MSEQAVRASCQRVRAFFALKYGFWERVNEFLEIGLEELVRKSFVGNSRMKLPNHVDIGDPIGSNNASRIHGQYYIMIDKV